jgi:hypothetical protein
VKPSEQTAISNSFPLPVSLSAPHVLKYAWFSIPNVGAPKTPQEAWDNMHKFISSKSVGLPHIIPPVFYTQTKPEQDKFIGVVVYSTEELKILSDIKVRPKDNRWRLLSIHQRVQ